MSNSTLNHNETNGAAQPVASTSTTPTADQNRNTTSEAAQGQGITEDEAALYDRQLRLWGVEAQNRMRSSSILIINLRSIAGEIIKNIVLAGVGKVTLVDSKAVKEEDLGANFFLREEDVGQKRVEAALPRIQNLNPRVQLESQTDASCLTRQDFIQQFDLIVMTDVDANQVKQMNTLTRQLNKKLYVASSLGIDGWIFADLLNHEVVVDTIKTVSPGESIKVPTKKSLTYTHFDSVLRHDWSKTRPRELKRTQENLWALLVLFEYQLRNPTPTHEYEPILKELQAVAAELLPKLGLPTSTTLLSEPTLSQLVRTHALEFSPSSAILGGIAGQDVLNVIGGKEEPVRNLLVFDGSKGSCPIWALGL